MKFRQETKLWPKNSTKKNFNNKWNFDQQIKFLHQNEILTTNEISTENILEIIGKKWEKSHLKIRRLIDSGPISKVNCLIGNFVIW